MEPVQALQSINRLEAVALTFPLRKRIADPEDMLHCLQSRLEAQKNLPVLIPRVLSKKGATPEWHLLNWKINEHLPLPLAGEGWGCLHGRR